jgi:hypothetical protein
MNPKSICKCHLLFVLCARQPVSKSRLVLSNQCGRTGGIQRYLVDRPPKWQEPSAGPLHSDQGKLPRVRTLIGVLYMWDKV